MSLIKTMKYGIEGGLGLYGSPTDYIFNSEHVLDAHPVTLHFGPSNRTWTKEVASIRLVKSKDFIILDMLWSDFAKLTSPKRKSR
jgi:hypothetical protein